MSAPGYWKKEGQEVPITALEDSHIKHICRYLLSTIRRQDIGISWKTKCETKIIEIGNEAQRRNLIPAGDITVDQLYVIVDGWEAEHNTRITRTYPRISSRPLLLNVTAPQPKLKIILPAPKLNENERLDAGLENRLLDIDL